MGEMCRKGCVMLGSLDQTKSDVILMKNKEFG
jgi:hypothetical protein